MRLRSVPQQFWQSWDDVPEEVPQDMLHLQFFVEVFAGKAHLTRAVRRKGKFAVLPPIEVDASEEFPTLQIFFTLTFAGSWRRGPGQEF